MRKIDRRTARIVVAAKVALLGREIAALAPEYAGRVKPVRFERWRDPDQQTRRVEDFVRRMTKPSRHSRNKFDHAPKASAAFVQGHGSGELTGATESLAYSPSNTAGNTLIVLWRDLWNSGASSGPSVADSQTNTWYQVKWGYTPVNLGGYYEQWYIFYAPNCKAGANTVSCTTSSGSSIKEFYIGEYSGLDTSMPLDICYASDNAPGSGAHLTMALYAQLTGMLVSCAFARGGSANAPSAQSGAGWSSSRYTRNGSDGGFACWDQVCSSTGTYTNNVTSAGGTNGQFNGLLILLRSAVPAQGCVQANSNSVTGSTTCAIPFEFANGSGHCLVAIVEVNQSTDPTISDSKSNTWISIGSCSKSAPDLLKAFYAPGCASGANTVTAAHTSSSTFSMTILEYAGVVSAYALEQSFFDGTQDGTDTTALGLGTANDIVVAAWSVNNAGGYGAACSGYSPRANFTINDTQNVFDLQVSSVQNLTNTITNSRGFGLYALFALRTATPTLGRLQSSGFVASTSVAFRENNTAGNLLLCLTRANGTMVVPTDSLSNTWKVSPVTIEQDSGDFYLLAYAINCLGGANTVTASGGNGIAVWEYAGFDTVSPMAGSSASFSQISSSTANPGPVTVYSTALLFSLAVMPGLTGKTFTPGSSAWIDGDYWSSTESAQQWDRVVAAGSYDNAITGSASDQYFNAFTIAFQSTQVNYPVLSQHSRASGGVGGDASFSSSVQVTAGNIVVVATASQSGSSTGTISDSQSNTYHNIAGGGAALFGVWWTVAGSSGTLTATNTNCNAIGVMTFDHTALYALDQLTAASGTGTSLNTGSITFGAANELIVSLGFALDATNRLQFTSEGSGWSGLIFSTGGHYVSIFSGWQSQAPAGTYSNTFTYGASMPLNAVIFSFKPYAGGVVTQVQSAS